MSGTSMDAIDSALVRCETNAVELLTTHEHSIPPGARKRIAELSQPGPNEIERMGVLDRELGLLFGEATLALLATAGVRPDQVNAIGSHGQTIRHRPPSGQPPGTHSFTLQIGDPNTIAECTGITTVADFRRRDIAAGGEGAPLAPAFHAAALSRPGLNRAIVNIGGIANATLLQGNHLAAGFDTGPGNTLLDHWIQHHKGEAYDCGGRWSSTGTVNAPLLLRLMEHPYFALSGPRSTGKEAFNLDWLEGCLADHTNLDAADVQASLAQLTANSIANALASSRFAISEVYICGGGAHNDDLMRRLEQLISGKLGTTAALGMDPDWVEAAAFAWLASCTLEGLSGNAPEVTGAGGTRILGGVYRAA